MNISSNITGIYAGGTGILNQEGHSSGIFKKNISHPIRVSIEGLSGDEHADLRVHGGPEKAVHHFAAENYARLSSHFPQCAADFVPGSIGENISTTGLTEQNVHIGDVFRLGSAIVQVSQPRSPCWKINHRFGADTISLVVAQERITGWYYRVLEEGMVQPGDSIQLVDRQSDRVSIDEFWRIQSAHRPHIDDMLALIAVPGLSDQWKARLTKRVSWLHQQAAS
jgi:MOSC domain-containing protein YiiM